MLVPSPPARRSPVSVDASSLIALSRFSRRIDLHVGRVRARHSGDHLSPFKGRGMEYDHSRQYVPGDDIRNMDWRVTARTGRPHTKLFHEERERSAYVWVDFRSPMFFATRGGYKAVIASECAALLAWSASLKGDRIGGLVFSEQTHHECKPGRGRAAVLHLIKQLAEHPAWRPPHGAAGVDAQSMDRALQRLLRVVHPGSLVFLISDFRQFGEAQRRHLLTLARHNELVLLFVYDPLERALPPAGHYLLGDEENEVTIHTGDRTLCARYARRFAERQVKLQQLARSPVIQCLECCTTDEPVRLLQAAMSP